MRDSDRGLTVVKPRLWGSQLELKPYSVIWSCDLGQVIGLMPQFPHLYTEDNKKCDQPHKANVKV
jgi:hypothetical protein